MNRSRAEILVIGDMHGLWSRHDVEFLEGGTQDLVMFVGDLGDENVRLVTDVANLDADKVVILGNHDAWQSFSLKFPTQKLEQSVEALGNDHLAYATRDIPAAGISIVGARPFSWGGQDIRSPEVYGHFYDVESMEESADLIVETALRAQFDDLIILAHNGPHGISSQPKSIYGKDFGKRPGGDWGDRDLKWALDRISASGRRVRAVVAGHMHHKLHPQIGGFRTRFVRREGTAFINPAIVPRIRRTRSDEELRHYLRMVWSTGQLDSIEEIWVDRNGDVREKFAPRWKDMASRAEPGRDQASGFSG